MPLLAACSSPVKPDDDSAPRGEPYETASRDTSVDSDSGPEPTSPCIDESGVDTGIGVSTFGGVIHAENGTASGTIGYTFYSFSLSGDGCVLEGQITSTDTVESCPDCSWSFDMTPIESSRATGLCCELLDWQDGQIDGSWDYDWGFSDYFAYPYNGYYIPLHDVVWIGTEGSWSLLSYSWPEQGLYLTYQYGDAVSFRELYASWP